MARIMVVEDEPITAADLEQKLSALGHEVVAWSDSGEEAIAQARDLSLDLVLMDIRLRGAMSGIEAARQLRRQSEVPVVFLTAFADQETVDRACLAEPYGYLLKPFSERAIATAVQVALTRAAADHARIERERWVSAGLRSAGEALVAVDQTGAIRFMNEHAEALLDVKAEDVRGMDARTIVRFVEEEGAGDATHPLEAALREGRVTSAARSLQGRGGTAVNVSYSAAPVLSSAGNARAGAVLVFREQLPSQGLDRLSAVNALSMRLSHEINNPLTYNLGALELALREIDQVRARSALEGADASTAEREAQLLRIERLLRDAEEGATRIAGVVRELTSFSLSERDLVALDPVEVLGLAIGMSGVGADDRVRFVRHVDPAPLVRGNRWQLSRVVAYALQNVADALDPQSGVPGLLELRVYADERGWACIRALARGRTGPPSSRDAEKSRGQDVMRPTSVGLAVAQHVVESHGGELELSETAEGRAIELRLPPISHKTARDLAGAAAAPRRADVLVVDDEPMIGRILGIMLQSHYEVTAVHSAEHALALLERGDAFDVILCDLAMPGMTGEELHERLSAGRPEVAARFIFMTGGPTSPRAARFVEAMADRCIEKPFSLDELLPLLAARVRARDAAAGRT
ncbi:MAG: response regulator [Deltaproteobacteria bacterium]|nr:response regulator [Deltaproteobacteria bacterium]